MFENQKGRQLNCKDIHSGKILTLQMNEATAERLYKILTEELNQLYYLIIAKEIKNYPVCSRMTICYNIHS